MKVINTPIEGLKLLEPTVFEDDRGYFFESYNKHKLPPDIAQIEWVQDNESRSCKGVIRGLHFQVGMMAQAKLIRVVTGEIYDVAVDIRKDSQTFGQWYGVAINGQNKRQLLIPRGFAHGFMVLSDEATFIYKCDNYYAPEAEGGIMWNDPDLNINWPLEEHELIISERDLGQPSFAQLSAKL